MQRICSVAFRPGTLFSIQAIPSGDSSECRISGDRLPILFRCFAGLEGDGRAKDLRSKLKSPHDTPSQRWIERSRSMTGNDKPNVVLQERDRRLFLELQSMRVVDREQASAICSFRSVSRCSARLLRLTRAGYLRTSFIGTIHGGRRALYHLPKHKSGARRARLFASVSVSSFLEHQLAVNAIYVLLKYTPIPIPEVSFGTWQWFRVPLSPTCALIPDGYVDLNTREGVQPMFLEVDLGTESLTVWRKKIRSYINLASSGQYEREFKRTRFRVLVIADTEIRAESIRHLISAHTSKIFWITTTKNLNDDGFWAPVWLRPASSLPKSLFERS